MIAIAVIAVAFAFALAAATGRSQAIATLAATGTVQAPQQLELAFADPGRLVEVDVHAGEQVTTGQMLARLDPIAAVTALDTARANLAAARAQLLQLREGLSPAGRAQLRVGLRQAKEALDAAGQALRDARDAATHDATHLQSAVTQANAQLASDQATFGNDQTKLRSDQAALNSEQGNADAAVGRVASDRSQLAADLVRLLADQKKQTDDEAASAPSSTLAADAKSILDDQATVAADQARLSDAMNDGADARSRVEADRSRVESDQQGLGADQSRIAADQDSLANAQDAQAAGTIGESQALHTAASTRAAAQLGLAAGRTNSALQLEPPRVGMLAAARAAVRVAAATVATAEQSLRETRLIAPFPGTIARVSAVAGQLVPGPGTGGLIALVNLSTLTVAASFDGAEAALLAPGQPATVTIPGLADQTLRGVVLAIAPLPDPSTDASTVATYTATIALREPPRTLRPGMQADVAVRAAVELRCR